MSKKDKKSQDFQKAYQELLESRHVSDEVLQQAFSEAMEKAYRKSLNLPKGVDLPEVVVKTEFYGDNSFKVFHMRQVVEDVTDDDMEISLEDAREKNPLAQLGDEVAEEVDLSLLERGAVILAKNVIRQKLKEAEKAQVYENYHDKVGDMITGTVESVENNFVLVRLGGDTNGDYQEGSALAMMKHSAQIPGEVYRDREPISVVITDVAKESKGAQVQVSRSTPIFIRRLFEKEVPEIYQGIIEIKSIARDPGARAKIAVYSHNENIDPIGACIGPRGRRVQSIIAELNGEKIDIFEWSDDLQQLVANALAPAQNVVVLPNPDVDRGLIAVVPDNQLSLAIGKKGQNARLAVKLTEHRIDIKSQTEMMEKGIDYQAAADAMHRKYEEEKAAERAYKQQQRLDELKNSNEGTVSVDDVDFTYSDDDLHYDDHLANMETLAGKEEAELPAPAPENKEEAPAPAEKASDRELDEMEELARIAKEKRKSLAEKRSTQYTSKLEAAASHTAEQQESRPTHKKKDEKPRWEEKKASNFKKKQTFTKIQPIYTEDELREIEENELEEELNAWNDDVDYEEYDEYYDDNY